MTKENLPYSFDDKERKIIFNKFDLPSPWINYLSNGKMHAFVSQTGGGLAWWRSPMQFRLTRYRFYNLPIDSPGFYVYIRMQDGTIWSPTFRPVETKADNLTAFHTMGYSSFSAEKEGLKATLTLFMAQDYDTLLWDLKLTNQKGEKVECDVFAYVELSQYMLQNEVILGYYLKWSVRAVYDQDAKAILYIFHSSIQPQLEESPLTYFGCSEKVDSYCCNRDLFCGNYRDERNPVEVEKGILSNTDMRGGEPCGALHTHISLGGKEEKQVYFYLGAVQGALKDYEKAKKQCMDILSALREEGAVKKQFDINRKWWQEHLDVMQCSLPDKDSERQINTWNPLQSVQTARFSRSISSTASGIRGIGFRDTCQDMLAQAYRKPNWARDMLFYLASIQFEDGHPVHQSWPEEKRLPQDITRSDNHIWMTYLAYAIIAETGDFSILDKEIPFLDKDMVSPIGKATLWEHLLRGVDFTENHIGEHGLPLILFSDWNDHFGTFGRKGKGESIFVAQQHIYSLRQLSEIAEIRGDKEAVERFKHLIDKQIDALTKYGWEGNWWLRGYGDDGKPIGTLSGDGAKIWLNTQSWAIIAGTGTKEQQITSMDNANKWLDTGLGLQINTPGFPTWPETQNPKVNGLPAGYSENAGVFCQANCWAIMAEALLGRGDMAWKYYKEIMPHEVIKKIGVEAYHSEAYAYPSTMLGKENEKFGWACVSQVTGTSAWMDVISTQYMLGIRPQLKGLLIDPSIPHDWKNYSVKRLYRGCELDILVSNPKGVEHGVAKITIDGKELDITKGCYITNAIIAGKKSLRIDVIMG